MQYPSRLQSFSEETENEQPLCLPEEGQETQRVRCLGRKTVYVNGSQTPMLIRIIWDTLGHPDTQVTPHAYEVTRSRVEARQSF